MGLRDLAAELQREAAREPFPLDLEAYAAWGRDPLAPILSGGSLAAPVCSLGRDLGADEVRWAQPQVGAAGRLVRRGVLAARGLAPAAGDSLLEAALDHVLLTNTVPYKPPGNRAYSPAVRERFRPFLARLLADHWQGDCLITLGTEAFQWCAAYLRPAEAAAFWARADRYETEIEVPLPGAAGPRRVRLCPLPHPSPLNRRWRALFPDLLAARLGNR